MIEKDDLTHEIHAFADLAHTVIHDISVSVQKAYGQKSIYANDFFIAHETKTPFLWTALSLSSSLEFYKTCVREVGSYFYETSDISPRTAASVLTMCFNKVSWYQEFFNALDEQNKECEISQSSLPHHLITIHKHTEFKELQALGYSLRNEDQRKRLASLAKDIDHAFQSGHIPPAIEVSALLVAQNKIKQVVNTAREALQVLRECDPSFVPQGKILEDKNLKDKPIVIARQSVDEVIILSSEASLSKDKMINSRKNENFDEKISSPKSV